MSYQTDMAAGFTDAQVVLGSITADWLDKHSVPIIIGDIAMMLALLDGGFLSEFSFGFTCNANDAPVAGAAGDQLAVAGTKYRIIKISNSPSNPLMSVYCKQVD